MYFLVTYFVMGIVVSVVVAFVGKNRRQGEFTPLVFLFDYNPVSFIFLFALWPLWIMLQLVERSYPPDPPRLPLVVNPPIAPGTSGFAMTDLKPGGRVRVGGAVIDATTESDFVVKGQEIEVLGPTPTGVLVRARQP